MVPNENVSDAERLYALQFDEINGFHSTSVHIEEPFEIAQLFSLDFFSILLMMQWKTKSLAGCAQSEWCNRKSILEFNEVVMKCEKLKKSSLNS